MLWVEIALYIFIGAYPIGLIIYYLIKKKRDK